MAMESCARIAIPDARASRRAFLATNSLRTRCRRVFIAKHSWGPLSVVGTTTTEISQSGSPAMPNDPTFSNHYANKDSNHYANKDCLFPTRLAAFGGHCIVERVPESTLASVRNAGTEIAGAIHAAAT